MKYFLLFCIIFLTGCQSNILKSEPTIFGIQEGQFRQLSTEQQHQLIESYNRQQEIKAKNGPIENLVGVLDKSIKQKDSRTTVQIHNHTIDQPVRQCRKENGTQICEEVVQTTQNNAADYNWEFGKR